MAWFESPTSFRLRELAASAANTSFAVLHSRSTEGQLPVDISTATVLGGIAGTMNDHASHPDFLHLAGLVCEAVLEVIFVALPGFIVAASGMFDANSQKFVAELNTMVFTPCLIFIKLASQLNAEKLADLAVIPFIFVATTIVSWISAEVMSRVFGFGHKKRQKNFVIAMGVFGNSNSLPISLVLSLSHTISGLHWDQVPGDNDNEVGARGILYLMIFQQLGQLLRWTWGYSVLLKPASEFEEEEIRGEGEFAQDIEQGRYRDDPDDVLNGNTKRIKPTDSGFGSGLQSPASSSSSSSTTSEDEEPLIPVTPANGNTISNEPRNLPPGGLESRSRSTGHMTTFPNFSRTSTQHLPSKEPAAWKTTIKSVQDRALLTYRRTSSTISTFFRNLYRRLPSPVQKVLATFHHYNSRFWAGVWRQMNPPLWAMLAALIVASVPALQHLFFTQGTFVNNSITRAVKQSGDVAVPLILVVLGANLARSTLPKDQLASSPEEKAEERRLLWASLLSRMVLPTIVMAPILALIAKYVPVSILDDPIFIIVCFLLTGAPSALQLAQICQINNVFMGAMSNLLVASYVFAIFPSTLALVMLALEVVEWAVV